jgi:nitroimidazol reductase NimA-like FMN-containing flavoprotein (pyridoxamine 5'-phosphate oxidase superfamily)
MGPDSQYNLCVSSNSPANDRLRQARNIWIATVRPDGRPHLTPIWFVHEADRWYICTSPESVKARNLKTNPHVCIALEDGDNAYVVEGTARAVTPPTAVVRQFKDKFDWDITTDTQYSLVFEIRVQKQLMGARDE